MSKRTTSFQCKNHKVGRWLLTFAIVAGLIGAQLPSVSAAEIKAAPRGPYAESNRAKAHLLDNAQQAPSFKVKLPAIADKEFTKLRDARSQFKRDVIGVGRELTGAQRQVALSSLAWTTATDGTQFTTLEFQSTDASAVRLALAPHGLPKGVTLYVYGATLANTVYGPYTASDIFAASEPFWLPVVEGDTLRVELQADRTTRFDSSTLTIPLLSHLGSSIGRAFKHLRDLNASGSCNQDITCQPPSSAALIELGKSVAKYYITTPSGQTGTCTGTLLATNGGPAPSPNYFITANHCIGSTAIANSMHFYWFFQRAACNGANPTTITETLGGATFVKTVPTNDMTLVRLNSAPPAGVVYAPWSSTSLIAGATVTDLHHPAGDVKKITVGTHQAFTDIESDISNNSGSHLRVLWNQSQGTTEPGSSGSAIFNATGQVVGTLSGGRAACGVNQTQPDWFGRFDQAYVALQPWLSPGAGGPPVVEPSPVIDLTSGTPASGSVAQYAQVWYRIQSTAANANLTVTLAGLTADADIYVYRNVQDTSVAPSCVSAQLNATNESCTVASPGDATWYIAVDGYQAANYTITATVGDATSVPIPPLMRGGGGSGEMSQLMLLVLSALFGARLLVMRSTEQVRTNDWSKVRTVTLALGTLSVFAGCANTQDTPAASEQNEMRSIVLPAPSDDELATLQGGRKDQPYRVGVGRSVPVMESKIALNTLSWQQDTSGSYASKISIQSIGARSIRVGLRLNSNVPGLELSFGESGTILRGNTILSASDKNIFWSPVIEGDTAIIKLTVPELPSKDAVLEVPTISHIP